jgi:hypothetical protein
LSNDTHCPKAVLISEKLHFISVKIWAATNPSLIS